MLQNSHPCENKAKLIIIIKIIRPVHMGKNDTLFLYPRCLQAREILLELLANMSMNVEVPEVSEDCLYLNIYTPSKPGDSSKLPVSVCSEFH